MITLPKKKGTRRSTLGNRSRGARAVALLWARRIGIWGGAAILCGWLGAWIVLTDTPRKLSNWAHETVLAKSAEAGFAVRNILVEGRRHTDPALLRGIANMQKGDPIFAFDPDETRAMIEKISWVKSARIERRLPDTIYIGIEERIPLALWQHQGNLVVIDAEGEVLTGQNLGRFSDLLIVTGEDAPAHAAALLALLRAEPELLAYAEAASRVGGRRWNLTLKNGVVVKLPEIDAGLALRRLAAAQDESGLLEKEIDQIDLREPERLTVRTKPGAVQTYNAGLKAGDPI